MRLKQINIAPATDKAYVTARKSKATAAIAKHDIVAVVGTTNSHQTVQPADANSTDILARTKFMVADYAVPSGNFVKGLVEWKLIQNVNTAGTVVGQRVYLSDTAGQWSLTPGTKPIPVGMVTVVHATAGSVLLEPGRFTPNTGGCGTPMLFKKNFVHGDITAAATTKAVNFLTLPSGSIVLACWIHVTTVFNNGAGNLQVDIGTSGDPNGFYVANAATEISSGTGQKTSASAPALMSLAWAGGWKPLTADATIQALFTSSSGNLEDSHTTGDMDVYVLAIPGDNPYVL